MITKTSAPCVRLALGAVILTIVGIAACARPKELSESPALTQARTALEASRWDEALQHLDKLSPAEAAAADAHYLRGQALDGLKRYREAAPAYAEALKLRPDWPEARFAYGRTLSEFGQFGESLQELERYLELRPRSVEGYTCQAEVHMIVADYLAAYDDWTKVIECSEKPTASMYIERGFCAFAVDIHVGELTNADLAIALEPNNVKAWEMRYHALEQMEAPVEDRLKAAQKLVELAPENSIFMMGLLIELSAIEDYEAIETAATKYLERENVERRENILTSRASARYYRGFYQGAIDDYCAAEQIGDPPHLEFYEYDTRANCYAKLGLHEQSIRDYSASLKLFPDPWTHWSRARAYMAAKDYASALRDLDELRKGVKATDEHYDIQELRLECYEELGMAAEAAATRAKLATLPREEPSE